MKKNISRYAKTILLSLVLFLAVTLVAIPVYAAEDTSSGTASVVGVDPVITSPELTDTGSVDKDGAQIDVNVEYWVKCNIAHGNTLEALKNVTYIIWGPSSTEGGADSEADHYTFAWTEGGTWEEIGPDSAGDSHLVIGSCQVPGDLEQSSGDFRLAFKLSKIAERTASATWTVKIIAYDDEDDFDSDASLDFGLNYYSEITVDDSTHGWTGLSPADADILLTSPGDFDIDVTVTSNADFDLQAKGDGPLTKGVDEIPLVNVEIHKDTLGSAVGLTTGYVDIGGLTAQSAGADQAKAFKLWITVPDPCPNGDYTYTLSVQVIEA